MKHIITFRTDKFNPSTEDKNLSNPYAGQSVLTWLRTTVFPTDFQCTIPDYEDWGWYMDVINADLKYRVGASCFWEQGAPEKGAPEKPDQEWLIQVVKERSLVDSILSRNKMTHDDSVAAIIVEALRCENSINDIEIEFIR